MLTRSISRDSGGTSMKSVRSQLGDYSPSSLSSISADGLNRKVIRVQLVIPDIQAQTTLLVDEEEKIWSIRQHILTDVAPNLLDGQNFGLFMPPLNGKAGKFLDDERTVKEYSLIDNQELQMKYKRRLYKSVTFKPRTLKTVNAKAERIKFTHCVEEDRRDRVRKALLKGLDPNYHDDQTGESPLGLAVALADPRPMILTLIEGGAHLDFRSKLGWTAVHRAALYGYQEALQTLLDLGASPNYRDKKGLTALYHCVCASETQERSARCVDLLLKERAVLDITDHTGWTELHQNLYVQTCRKGRVKVVEQLIYYGADVNAKNGVGNTPLHLAVLYNQMDCARLLLFRGADKSIKNFSNQDPALLAVVSGNQGMATLIKEHKHENVVLYKDMPEYSARRRQGTSGYASLSKGTNLTALRELSHSTPMLNSSPGSSRSSPASSLHDIGGNTSLPWMASTPSNSSVIEKVGPAEKATLGLSRSSEDLLRTSGGVNNKGSYVIQQMSSVEQDYDICTDDSFDSDSGNAEAEVDRIYTEIMSRAQPAGGQQKFNSQTGYEEGVYDTIPDDLALRSLLRRKPVSNKPAEEIKIASIRTSNKRLTGTALSEFMFQPPTSEELGHRTSKADSEPSRNFTSIFGTPPKQSQLPPNTTSKTSPNNSGLYLNKLSRTSNTQYSSTPDLLADSQHQPKTPTKGALATQLNARTLRDAMKKPGNGDSRAKLGTSVPSGSVDSGFSTLDKKTTKIRRSREKESLVSGGQSFEKSEDIRLRQTKSSDDLMDSSTPARQQLKTTTSSDKILSRGPEVRDRKSDNVGKVGLESQQNPNTVNIVRPNQLNYNALNVDTGRESRNEPLYKAQRPSPEKKIEFIPPKGVVMRKHGSVENLLEGRGRQSKGAIPPPPPPRRISLHSAETNNNTAVTPGGDKDFVPLPATVSILHQSRQSHQLSPPTSLFLSPPTGSSDVDEDDFLPPPPPLHLITPSPSQEYPLPPMSPDLPPPPPPDFTDFLENAKSPNNRKISPKPDVNRRSLATTLEHTTSPMPPALKPEPSSISVISQLQMALEKRRLADQASNEPPLGTNRASLLQRPQNLVGTSETPGRKSNIASGNSRVAMTPNDGTRRFIDGSELNKTASRWKSMENLNSEETNQPDYSSEAWTLSRNSRTRGQQQQQHSSPLSHEAELQQLLQKRQQSQQNLQSQQSQQNLQNQQSQQRPDYRSSNINTNRSGGINVIGISNALSKTSTTESSHLIGQNTMTSSMNNSQIILPPPAEFVVSNEGGMPSPPPPPPPPPPQAGLAGLSVKTLRPAGFESGGQSSKPASVKEPQKQQQGGGAFNLAQIAAEKALARQKKLEQQNSQVMYL